MQCVQHAMNWMNNLFSK